MSHRTDTELARLKTALGDQAARFDADLLETCPSTNTLLLERAAAGAPSGSVVWALDQTAGRGRRGREWISSPADSLTFSLLWRFDAAAKLAGLSLLVGLAVADALDALGARGVALKWPNDIWLDGRKLGGVLVELQQTGPRTGAVIGIGINLALPPAGAVTDQAVAALSQALSPVPPAATVLAEILVRLGYRLDRFLREGFAPQRDEWGLRNALAGQPVRLIDDSGETLGTCLGVDVDGALLLGVGAAVHRILGGDVSLRKASA